ncbi:MAG: AsmA-like C-terminal region-containing protein [Planctomycetota bacterium]|nr:AsmA-like C-terminal region-containing protein [Planctomycetota bacterium]
MESPSRHNKDTASNRNFWVRGMASFGGFVSFLLIIALTVFVALLLLKDTLNDQIRKTVEEKIGQVFGQANVEVTLDQAEYKRGRGIRFRGLRLVEGTLPLVSIDTVFIQSEVDLWGLINGELAARSIELDGIRIYARQDEEQGLNFERIFRHLQIPNQSVAVESPEIHLRDCVVSCQLERGAKPIELRLKQGEVRPGKSLGGLLATASISSDWFKSVQLSLDYAVDSQDWRVWGSADQLLITPEVFESLPAEIQKEALALKALQAKVDFDFEVSSQGGGSAVPRFFLIGHLNEGKISDARLPFPITELTANFSADNAGISFENVIADSSLGQMHLNFTTEGLSANSPFELLAKVDPLFLDQRLISRLPPEAREFLQKFSPVGNIKLNSKLSFENGRWVPDVVVDLLDVSFAFHKFPYPLTHSTGRITLDEEKIKIDIEAFASGKRVKMQGEFFDPGPSSFGELSVDLEGQIPIDAKVLVAMEMKPEVAAITKKFHPRGSFGFQGLFQRVKKSNGQIEERFKHQVPVQDVEFKYDRVPIPFTNVFGTFVITQGGTRFQGFRGLNVKSENFAEGSWDRVNGLNLTIDSFDVELNESLKNSLPKAAIKFWDDLRPSGTLQAVRSHLRAIPAQPVDFDFQVHHQDGEHSVAVNPNWFPYELKNISGVVSFQPNQFKIFSFKGQHRKSVLSVRGDGAYDSLGWECSLERIHFDRLVPDREFTSALPEALGNVVDSFRVTGMTNVVGKMAFKSTLPVVSATETSSNQLQTTWDLTADIDQGSLVCGVEIEDIYGAVRVTGVARGEQFESFGGLEIDSLVWNDLQFKNVRSPIYVDNNVALLGLWATAKKPGTTPEPLSAVLFGGRLAANAQFSLHGNQPFQMQATLNAGDLEEFTFELAPSYSDIVGDGYGGIRITGDNTGTHSLRGEGQMRLVDAKISEVPIMLGLLKILSVNQIDRTLFNESKIDFTIKGEHVFFDNLEFLGDAISIKGNGEMDFEQNIDLQFYTAVGRDGFRIPLISPVLGIASQQILVIDVEGTTQDPKVKKNFFKILNGKLKSNLEDLEETIGEGGDRIREAAERPLQNLFR